MELETEANMFIIIGDYNINPLNTELFNLNFQPLEVASRYRDPQPEVTKNYSNCLNISQNIHDYRRFETYPFF